MSEELRTLMDFAEGRLQAREFEALLYANPAFEQVLDDDPRLEPGTYVGASAYLFVLRCNFGLPDGVRSAHGAVVDFLRRNGHEVDPADEIADFHQMLLRAQPRWLDVPMKYLTEHVLPALEGWQGMGHGELEGALRDELKRRFRFNKTPPRWIQNPEWPIGPNGPLVFLGRLPVYVGQDANSATLFVFRDGKTGEIQTVEQCD